MMPTQNNKQGFKENEVVWHYNFQMRVTFCGESPPISKKEKDKWYMVQLPNGGMHETQMIEKYNNQDGCEYNNQNV